MLVKNPHMLWKRLAPILLAAAVLATATGAVYTTGTARDCWPAAPVQRFAL
jgi:hypothetical protein